MPFIAKCKCTKARSPLTKILKVTQRMNIKSTLDPNNRNGEMYEY